MKLKFLLKPQAILTAKIIVIRNEQNMIIKCLSRNNHKTLVLLFPNTKIIISDHGIIFIFNFLILYYVSRKEKYNTSRDPARTYYYVQNLFLFC